MKIQFLSFIFDKKMIINTQLLKMYYRTIKNQCKVNNISLESMIPGL